MQLHVFQGLPRECNCTKVQSHTPHGTTLGTIILLLYFQFLEKPTVAVKMKFTFSDRTMIVLRSFYGPFRYSADIEQRPPGREV